MNGGYFEVVQFWTNDGPYDQLHFKQHGWTTGDPVWIVESYASGSNSY